MCGGTAVAFKDNNPPAGLSPRVRGNPTAIQPHPKRGGSIPACAGEPSLWHRGGNTQWVYPRVCGGTSPVSIALGSAQGLSPRVRGNPTASRWRPGLPGSIPACAGEPLSSGSCQMKKRVYPRVCGGTGTWFGETFGGLGLSPRVRGNPRITCLLDRTGRSIPACAGEPPPRMSA